MTPEQLERVARRHAPPCPQCRGTGVTFGGKVVCTRCAGNGRLHLAAFVDCAREVATEKANACLDRLHPIRKALDAAEEGMRGDLSITKPLPPGRPRRR